jgi:predicted nucleotidyltransferase
MDLSRWPHLARLVNAATGLGALQVWLFGSALRDAKPSDLDVLVVYRDRATVVALRNAEFWEDYSPPCDIIAMTPSEESEYDFVATTSAVRLT